VGALPFPLVPWVAVVRTVDMVSKTSSAISRASSMMSSSCRRRSCFASALLLLLLRRRCDGTRVVVDDDVGSEAETPYSNEIRESLLLPCEADAAVVTVAATAATGGVAGPDPASSSSPS